MPGFIPTHRLRDGSLVAAEEEGAAPGERYVTYQSGARRSVPATDLTPLRDVPFNGSASALPWAGISEARSAAAQGQTTADEARQTALGSSAQASDALRQAVEAQAEIGRVRNDALAAHARAASAAAQANRAHLDAENANSAARAAKGTALIGIILAVTAWAAVIATAAAGNLS